MPIAPQGSINEMMQPVFSRCDSQEKTYTAGFATDDRAANPNGVLHGGLIATAMDNVMGILSNFYGDSHLTQTISFQVSYLRPGTVGGRLMVRARITKQGRNVQYLNAEAWMEGTPDKLVATATGVYYTKGEKTNLQKPDLHN